MFHPQQKIKVAIVVFGGLSAGGTEKFLQTIAANLNKKRYEVDYYYCNSAPTIGAYVKPSPQSEHRLIYLKNHNVDLIEFYIEAKDLTSPYHNWVNTNFFTVFDETKYDIIQTGRAGHKEFPFNKIKRAPIVDSIHLKAGVDNQYNIARVMHICQWSAKQWTAAGGDKSRIVQVSHPMEINSTSTTTLHEELGILRDKMIHGFHQRDADSIFSPIPLAAFATIANENNHFIIMGGSQKYQEQAASLDIQNISFIPHNADPEKIYSFLRTLNVYAHGRKDGEVNSTAMAEAMYFGLPIVSHRSSVNNGHVECIANAGVVLPENDIDSYATELSKLQNDKQHYTLLSQAAKLRFKENYELTGQMKRIESIYEDVFKNPFPHPIRRFLYSLHWTQNIRIWLKWVYLKSKYYLIRSVQYSKHTNFS